MRKVLIGSVILLLSFNVLAQVSIKGLHCGTRGSFLGIFASDFLIPDYFPPENLLLRVLLVTPSFINLEKCEENHDPVHLGEACIAHDQCYRTIGANKDICDGALLTGWVAACGERYITKDETSELCHQACNSVVEIMHMAMRYNDGVFCPSCTAFERDQEQTRKQKTSN